VRPPPPAHLAIWGDDDYDVLADGVIVGRIMKTAAINEQRLLFTRLH
jgi:hypothetical protein